MVSRRFEWTLDAGEDTDAVMLDHRRLAMHDLRRGYDIATVDLPDALMPETDAEDWHAALTEMRYRHRRDPCVFWSAGARRDQTEVGLQRNEPREVQFIISHDYGLRTQFANVLHEVVDEAVVVVDYQYSRGHDERLPASPIGLTTSLW